MNFITEKNVSRIIIYLFIIIFTSMTVMISYVYVQNTYEDFDIQMKKFENNYYDNQKKILAKEIKIIIDIVNYHVIISRLGEKELKQKIIRLINNISFEREKSNYMFVYDIKNFEGGDNFARLLVNQNRPDLVGQMISTNYKDANGKKFREEFLENIRLYGQSYTSYVYIKPISNKIEKKLSYFKLYPKWNWVIAVGIYLDGIEKEIKAQRKNLKQRVTNQIIQNIVFFLLFLSIAIVASFLISDKIDEVLKQYQDKVKLKSDALKELNETLEIRVKEEIEKNREKEQVLVQKSRFIALGEMISNIAHQWRQPLSELSSILMYIKFKYNQKQLDQEKMDKKILEADTVIEFMSHTIDDFRNFFISKKEKEEFCLYTVLNSVMTIISSTLSNQNIKVNINVNKELKVYSYINEYEQVILNIISNAKDALISNNIKNPLIKVYTKITKKNIVLCIEDNAGGIKVEPIDKIFEPYFTTKKDDEGTGIGLYMSSIIVNKNMQGKLKVQNTKDGAFFSICLPIINSTQA